MRHDAVVRPTSPPETGDHTPHNTERPLGTGRAVGVTSETETLLSMSLTVEPSKIGAVRRAVVNHLKDVGLKEAAPDVGLVVTELLANVHKHAEGICHLEIEPRGERLVLRLSDTVHNLPTVRQRSDCAETGRGLLLVAALTEHWKSDVTPTGKVVTCTFHTAALSSQTEGDR